MRLGELMRFAVAPKSKLVRALVICGLIAGLLFWPRIARLFASHPDLPLLEDVQAMQFVNAQTETRLDVPRPYWKAILSTLAEARGDLTPAKWEIYGNLEIRQNDGSGFIISLFRKPDDELVFAAGDRWETRQYYRGGSSKELFRALKEAGLGNAESISH